MFGKRFLTQQRQFLFNNRFATQRTMSTLSVNQHTNGNYYNTGNSRNNSMIYFIAPAAALAYYMSQQDENRSRFPSECETSRIDQIRGTYENKIRFFSPPEKTFEIFATKKNKDGAWQMSYADFLHCMTPYNNADYNNRTEEYLKNITPAFIEFADCDGDGTIEFSEFYFFMSLMQIPDAKLRKSFKKAKHSMKWNEDEMKTNLIDLLLNSTGQKHQEKVTVDARAVKVTRADLMRDIEKTAERIFKGKKEIAFEDFLAMRKKMRDDLLSYEFFNFDPSEDNTISLEQWLFSVMKSIKGSKREMYKRQIKKIVKAHPDTRITYEEFCAFSYWLRELHYLRSDIEKYRVLDWDGFHDHMHKFCEKNDCCIAKKAKMSEDQILAIFNVLDDDESGELEKEEILDVLSDPLLMGQSQESKAKEEFANWSNNAGKSVLKKIGNMMGVDVSQLSKKIF